MCIFIRPTEIKNEAPRLCCEFAQNPDYLRNDSTLKKTYR